MPLAAIDAVPKAAGQKIAYFETVGSRFSLRIAAKKLADVRAISEGAYLTNPAISKESMTPQ